MMVSVIRQQKRTVLVSPPLLVKSHPQGQSNALIKAAHVFLQQEMTIISSLGGRGHDAHVYTQIFVYIYECV